MNPILKQNGIFFGLILGVLFFIPSIIALTTSVDFLLGQWATIIVLLGSVILGVVCVSIAKGKLQGIISLKQCFITYFIMVVIALFLSASLEFITFNFVKPDFVNVMKQRNIELTEEYKIKVLSSDNLIDEEKEKITKKADEVIALTKKVNPYSVSSLFSKVIKFIGILSIFGLLISLILKTPKQVS